MPRISGAGFGKSSGRSVPREGLRLATPGWCVVWKELEQQEALLLETELGKAAIQDTAAASRRAEGLAVLAWALHRFDLPEYDEPVDAKTVTDAVGFLADHSLALEDLRLRPTTQLAEVADTYFAAHWRLVEYSLRRKKMDFADFARTAWFGPLRLADLRLKKRDLAIGRKPLWAAKRDEFFTCLSIIQERHRAANWLLGYNSVYSEVGIDT